MAELLKPSEAAKELDVSPQWVTTLLRQGKIKGQRVGSQWIITRRDLNKYMASQKEAENNK